MERRMVVLFGGSLLVDAVEAGLRSRQELDVVRLDSPITDEGGLRSLSPDLVIFDLDIPPEFILRFLRDRPGVPLLGLDVTSNQVILISSQQQTLLTVDDLTQMIRLQTSHCHLRAPSSRAGQKEIWRGCMPRTLRTDILQ